MTPARRLITVIAAAAGVLSASSNAAAQSAAEGPWFHAAIGYGRLRVTCASCSNVEKAGGTAVTLSVGGHPSATVRLGVQGQIWRGSGSASDERVRTIGLVAQWYPWRQAHPFLRGGTGLVFGPVAPSDSSGQRSAVYGRGVYLSLGLGYDIPLGPRIALTADASTHIAALGDLVLPGTTADDTIAYVSRFGIGLTIR